MLGSPPLKPRAIAAMCALRIGARSVLSLCNSIGDLATSATRDLMDDLRDMRLVQRHGGSELWGLTYDGLGWLQSAGIDASKEAKVELAELATRSGDRLEKAKQKLASRIVEVGDLHTQISNLKHEIETQAHHMAKAIERSESIISDLRKDRMSDGK